MSDGKKTHILAERVLIAATVAALALLAMNLIRYRVTCDDAFISFRYLENWVSGEGLVFNSGERVEGYTNFLWIVVLAPLRLIGVPAESGAMFLSLVALAALLGAVYVAARRMGGSSSAGWCAVILAAGSTSLAYWTLSGMETVFFAALLALANARLAVQSKPGARSGLLFGLSALARPEGLLHGGAAFAALPWRGDRRSRWGRPLLFFAIALAALPLLHVTFRMAYYGAPLPNTFYAKMTGDMPNLMPSGLAYLWGFLASGECVLVLAALLIVLAKIEIGWVRTALALQVVVHTAYVIWIGGDYFPFGRFLVPVVPALAVLGGVGLQAAFRRLSRIAVALPAAALAATLVHALLTLGSAYNADHQELVGNYAERGLIAEWLTENYPPDTTLAINAAGLIPFRTGMPTIDMLGLNDREIARSDVDSARGGSVFVGHFKHDGRYVFERAPDVLLTGGATLLPAGNADEAILHAPINTFPGDREFLAMPDCERLYEPVAEELETGKFVVAYVRKKGASPEAAKPAEPPATAEGWFRRGLEQMRWAKYAEAAEAFRKSLALRPGVPVALANLAYCLKDLGRHAEAITYFKQALDRDPNHHNAVFGLAMTYQEQGNRDEAIRMWRRYLSSAPESQWKENARKSLAALEGKGE